MFDKMKQLMEFKKQADQIKKSLENSFVEVTDVPGIKIVVDGAQNFKSVEISEELLNPSEKVKFETTLLKSLNAASKRSQQLAAEKMKGAMPGGFPGL